LDIGLTNATTGHRVFGVLKGAVDGGLNVPHTENKFPGFFKGDDETTYDAAVHRDRILGVHIDNYMGSCADRKK
jgi:large subunit ribosomal protein L5e